MSGTSHNLVNKSARDFIRSMADQVSMPRVYHEVRRLIHDQQSTLEDFSRIIETDSMLSVRLVRIANSSYFGYPSRATSVYKSLVIIGLMQLHDLILNSLSLRLFSSIPLQMFNLEEFWRYKIECGIAARTLAQYSQIYPLNPFFTLGLLHEIGHAVMFAKQPELSLQAMEQAETTQASLVEIERSLFGFDYTQAGVALMRQWHLPESYHQACAYHLNPEHANETNRQTVRIVHLAHMLRQNIPAEQCAAHLEECRRTDSQFARLPSNIIDIVHAEIAAHTDDALEMLWPHNVGFMDFPTAEEDDE
jgi:HD-like signal output (HDOD) protein